MKLNKGYTLKFRITCIVLIILIGICFILTYTSIYNNRDSIKIAVQAADVSSLYEDDDTQIYATIPEESDIASEENGISSETGHIIISNTDNMYIEEDIEQTENYVSGESIPIDEVIDVSQLNFKNMQIIFMVIMVISGSIITYFVLSKSLNPLTKMVNVIENINHNNLDEEIILPKNKDEIYILGKSFNDMLARIKHSFKMEKNFSASASHELKTPLSIMKSSIQVLKLSEQPTIEEYKENVEVMEENIERLIDIVNNLLLLTSSEVGLFEKIDIKNTIDKIILNYEEDLKNKNIKITNNLESLNINSNKALINCIFENIISNAIKYNKVYGQIIIDFEKDKEKFKIIIKDTGIGISKDNLDIIFNPFFREDSSRSKEIKGNGLGLSLVKNILEKINGNILIESEKDLGTKVTIVFNT